jgi:hypothetical protein
MLRVFIIYQYIVALRIIMMSFIGNVIEVRQLFGKSPFVLALLEHILLFIPVPWLVYLSKVFYYKRACLDDFLLLIEYS